MCRRRRRGEHGWMISVENGYDNTRGGEDDRTNNTSISLSSPAKGKRSV